MAPPPIRFVQERDARAALRTHAQEAKAWLFEHALPLWWTNGFDRKSACFHERLELDGSPHRSARRVRVQARQTAVYALAGKLGWNGPWRDAVESGVNVLLTRALRPDGGCVHLLDADGAVADPRRDLYDMSFVVFALAEASVALGRRDLATVADAQVSWIERHWSLPQGGIRRRRNSRIAAAAAEPSHASVRGIARALPGDRTRAEDLARAEHMQALFSAHFFDSATRALPEYFADDWSPLAGGEGSVEPGHEFEWFWLLNRLGALTGRPVHEAAAVLLNHAERHGVDKGRAAVFDEISKQGAPRRETARLWPQTERLRAHLVQFERHGDLARRPRPSPAYIVITALPGYADARPLA